jgi:arylsulfatase A-like enzyme
MRAMPRVKRLIGRAGATFDNSFSTSPLCCPARASILTGQYPHNHGVLTNGVTAGGGFPAFDDDRALPVWLKRSGYATGFVGKYLNGYGEDRPRYAPPGWSDWKGSTDPQTYSYYNQRLSENGSLHRYPGVYATHLAARKTRGFIKKYAPRPGPFFYWTSFVAPHNGGPREPGDPLVTDPNGLATPAVSPAYRNFYADVPLPRDESFNESDVSDKPSRIADRPLLEKRDIAQIREQYQQRLPSLRPVDDAVASIITTLREVNQLANTLVVFTSDNGWMSGQYRGVGKTLPDEPSIRVPLLVRGPGVPRGIRVQQTAATIDLAPTMMDTANATANLTMDGRSLLPLMNDPASTSPRNLVLEIGNESKAGVYLYRGLRTPNWTYVEYHTGEKELYDVRSDRFQVSNLHGRPEYTDIERSLADELAVLRECAGAACR